MPARFGGEEFAILLPETPPDAGVRDRRADPPRGRRARVRRRDLERADPGHGLDRRRRVPAGRRRRERADPPGRPRRLPREAPGPQPRARRERRAAAARPRSAGRASSRCPRTGEHVAPLPPRRDHPAERERRAPAPAAVHGPRFLSLSRRLALLVGLVSVAGSPRASLGLVYGHSDRLVGLFAIVALVGARAGARAGGRRRLDLGQRGRRDRRRRALRAARRPPARDHDRRPSSGARAARRSTRCCSTSARSRSPRSRPQAVFTRGLRRQPSSALVYVVAGVAAGVAYFVVNMGLISLVLAIEGHERWWRGLPGALRLARDPLPRLRLHRRASSRSATRPRLLGAGRVRAAAAADAQDAGGVPPAHAAKRAEAAPGGRDDPDPERLARAGEQAPAASARRLRWRASRPPSTRGMPTPPAIRGASSSSRWRSAASSASRRRSSTCSGTRPCSTTSASSRSRTRSCSSRRA